MKKKVLFYCRANQSLPQNLGVSNKCHDQVEALRNIGWEVDYCWLDHHGLYLNDHVLFKMPTFFRKIPIYQYYFFYCQLHRLICQKIDFSIYDLIYWRYELSHPQFIQTLKVVRLKKPTIKTIIELPTYPYISEQSGVLRKIQYLIDRIYRKRLAGTVELIVHYGKQNKIFGIEAMGISNGVGHVEKDQNKPITAIPENSINLIAVGTWNYWHGLDRLILSLKNYYDSPDKSYDIKLTIIGDGAALPAYKKLVSDGELRDRIIFMPAMSREKLMGYFERSDIGIGTLAIFRKGLTLDSSLKHREYCAAGLPFILSTKDFDFPPSLPWVFYVPENDEPISVEMIIQFYEINLANSNLINEIKEYAIQRLSWESRWHQILGKLGAAYSTIDS